MRQIDHVMVAGAGNDATGGSGRTHKVWNPSTGEVQAEVALGDAALLDRAVAAAKVQRMGRDQPAAARPRDVRVQAAGRGEQAELAELLSSEHGKVVDDAHGDVQRGLEVIEYACGIPRRSRASTARCRSRHRRLFDAPATGHRRRHLPFNFPAMIPMRMFGMAIAAGNAFILKPSERDPSVPVRLAELFAEAGAPEGLRRWSTATRKWSMPFSTTRISR